MKAIFDNLGAAYEPKRDGPLEEYLKIRDGFSCFPLFRGYKQFKMLWDLGYLEPHISVIRLMWNLGRGDEHYGVLGEFELEGIENHAHGGEVGTHDVRKLLKRKQINFEALHLATTPISRVTERRYFIFEYYHDRDSSALVLCESDLKRMRLMQDFHNVDPTKHNQRVWTERCLDKLVEVGAKEVFSVHCKDAMRDDFLGFTLHYSGGRGEYFFHYDFVSPEVWGETFAERGITLKKFERP